MSEKEKKTTNINWANLIYVKPSLKPYKKSNIKNNNWITVYKRRYVLWIWKKDRMVY